MIKIEAGVEPVSSRAGEAPEECLVMRIWFGDFVANVCQRTEAVRNQNVFTVLKEMIDELENLHKDSKEDKLGTLENNVKEALDKLLEWVNKKG